LIIGILQIRTTDERSRFDTVCLYATSRGSLTAVGVSISPLDPVSASTRPLFSSVQTRRRRAHALKLPPRLWCSPEHSLRHCPAPPHASRTDRLALVSRRIERIPYTTSAGCSVSVQCTTLLINCRPMKILRTFPPLDARPVIAVTVALVKDIPEDVYRELVAHPFTS
jgi:hypothetical protein